MQYNTQAFIDHAAELINAVNLEFLVYDAGSEGSGIKYVKLNNAFYEMRRFDNEDLIEVFASNVRAVEKQEKTLFSHIIVDSNSGPERTFTQACEDSENVLFYIKLPSLFQIDTPVRQYNPDWAVVYRKTRNFTSWLKPRRPATVTMFSLISCARLKI